MFLIDPESMHDKTNKNWVVRKNESGKRICIGRFKTLDDAKEGLLMYGLI